MDDARFIEKSVLLQLGGVLARGLTQSSEASKQALAGSSGSALLWRSAEGRPGRANGWLLSEATHPRDLITLAHRNKSSGFEKPQGALRALLAAGMRFDAIIDMQDRRLRNLALPDGSVFPTFCFNRETGSDQRILWPLPLYHDLGTPGFLGPSDWTLVPWKEKVDRLVWRGIHGGRPDIHGDPRREGMRLKPLLRKYDQGDASLEEVTQLLEYFPRHRIVQRYIDDPRFDLGFTGSIQDIPLENYAFMRPLIRPRMTQQEMLKFKYLLVLRGGDVGSSFYWTMNSGSLGLVMEGYFESFASGHFRPWEHFVPFKADLSDLEERLEWCRAHDADCAEMARRAKDMCRWLARGDLRDEIAREIVARVDGHL